jgi:hypothetical protein
MAAANGGEPVRIDYAADFYASMMHVLKDEGNNYKNRTARTANRVDIISEVFFYFFNSITINKQIENYNNKINQK